MGQVDINDPSLAATQQTPEEYQNEQYSTPGQQALTALEGVGQGLAGPLATAAEAGLSKLGVPGLSPKEQSARAQANPITRFGSEATSFGLSSLYGVGEARLLSGIGNVAAHGIEGASLASRIGVAGIKTGAEIAALQTGSELSKMINQDPNQTIGSAAINVGLAGLLGGATGVGLGAVSELWKSGAQKAADFLTDAKERIVYRQLLESNKVDPIQRGFFDIPTFEEAGVKETLGHKLGDYLFEKGQQLAEKIPEKAGNITGKAIGAGLGALAGHPIIGGYIGGRTLGPIFESIAKPLMEGATNPEGFKSALDYVANAAKGSELLNKAIVSTVKSGEVIPQHLIPTQASRDKLQQNLSVFNDPDKIINSGGQLGHYLPQHQTAAAALISQVQSTLDAQKPKTQAASPWQDAMPPTPLQQAKYNRLLDVAQQPLMVLKYAQEGTLTNNDVANLNRMYPGLAKAYSAKLGEELVKAKAAKIDVPYHVRSAISKLAGVNLDASQSPQAMQAIMLSAAPQQHINKTSGGRNLPKGHTTAAQLKAIDQTNKLYSTRTQAREAAEAAEKA